jgi:exodeoxyribonuclease VIII
MKPDGLYPEMSREDYDAEEREHWSGLKHMGKSPAHYLHHQANPDPDTNARKLGRCAHMAVLEPVRFSLDVAVWTGGRRYGREWDEFCERNAGLELITGVERAHCDALQKAARASLMAAPYLSGGHAEVSVLWTHDVGPEVGEKERRVAMKGRIDFLTAGAIVDLKTTKDASPEGFGREVWRYHHHTQGALYSDAVFALTGKRLPVVFVAIETEPPHVVQPYLLADIHIEAGREEYRTLLGRLALCRAEGRWPGYREDVSEVEMPKWSGIADDEDLTGLELLAPDEDTKNTEAA